ncbi:unnamed protein product [Euphydryas editha]|uniref:DNA oxidative demethylase ALKBH2 n=1 Tax=Euphydryas editha TaxID=104508 RepID=A0AAU9TMV8_EUPED|nr:unnamed protein product [Euphydryas editha]
MYIALKWLVSLVLVMWLALCVLDAHRKKNLTQQLQYDLQTVFKSFYNTTSHKVHKKSYNTERIKIPNDSHNNIYLQYFMFLAGACMVTVFNRKNDIIRLTKRKVTNFNFDSTQCLKKTTKLISAAIVKYYKIILTRLLKTSILKINLILLNKFKKMRQEQRNLGDLLITRREEIKNIRMRYQLDTEAKYEDVINKFPKKQLLENQSLNISFQQLYLITHQENIFLKSKIKKLTKEKEDAERKLIKLISQVCQSKNNDLKVYCSKFIVHTKNNLLNSDVKAEIDKFLRKSSDVGCFQENYQSSEQNTCGNSGSLTIKSDEFIDNKTAAVQKTTKLRGQSGEYVWIVKDKYGIIEKLYECGEDFDNGDTVRRIRQYSVYYDTECLLDLDNSTFVNNQDADVSSTRNTFTNYKLTVEISMAECLEKIDLNSFTWRKIREIGLDLEYAVTIPRPIATTLLKELEETLCYFTGDLAQIKVFGKIYPLPRQQVAYGDPGITYTYSGITVPALPWPPVVLSIRDFLYKLKGIKYDFVLVNKYRNGNDHMGEHRDNEPDLDPNFPIASVSLGVERPFVLKHKDARKPKPYKKMIPKGKFNLY